MKKTDLVIIGGGPAGMAAAIEGVSRNLSVVLIEDCDQLGGKILKRLDPLLQISKGDSTETRVREGLFAAYEEAADRITLLSNSEVWGVSPDRTIEICTLSPSGSINSSVQAKKIIIANGAVDRIVPFPGWHLPGVFTVGGLNTFVKKGAVPGKNFVVAGTGPLQIALAYYLVKSGANLTAVVDSAPVLSMVPTGLQLMTGGGVENLSPFGRVLFLAVFHCFLVTSKAV